MKAVKWGKKTGHWSLYKGKPKTVIISGSEIWQQTDPATGFFLLVSRHLLGLQPSLQPFGQHWGGLFCPLTQAAAWCLGRSAVKEVMLSIGQVGRWDVIPCAISCLALEAGAVPLLHPLCSHCLLKGRVKSWQLLRAEFIQREPALTGARLYLYFVCLKYCVRGSVTLWQ